MKCPSCNRDILDSAIICPYCNAQFAFSPPSSFNPGETNIYEHVQVDGLEFNPTPIMNKVEDTSHEEEINPDEMTYYVDETIESLDEQVVDNKNLNFAGQNPVALNGIKPESPNNMITVEHVEIKQETPPVPTGPIQTDTVLVNPTVPVNNQPVNVVNQVPNVQNPSMMANVATPQIPQQAQMVNQNTGMVQQYQPMVNNKAIQDATPQVTNFNNESFVKKKYQKDQMFFMSVIIVGSIVFVIIAFMLLLNNNKKKLNEQTSIQQTSVVVPTQSTKPTNNIGHYSSFVSPMYVGNTTLASIYDEKNNEYTNVDVYGVRFITGVEAEQMGAAYGKKHDPDFIFEGFEYKVKFNDLDYLGSRQLSPVLNAMIMRTTGIDYYNYNGATHFIQVNSIYDGDNIKNGDEATVKVIYSIPDNVSDYSLCFGYRNTDTTLGCFKKNSD